MYSHNTGIQPFYSLILWISLAMAGQICPAFPDGVHCLSTQHLCPVINPREGQRQCHRCKGGREL
ncbi:unnamed protein product [Nyctereutes procyonoides]|uniref:(raccoon dog) hypothetical protein n=1 Tax=Nyctereutes procyonoides TaxID=34880 RepID=A0A811ZQU8_NYCPR|nr:unnamed protein product [Nyctereutes procyonoides]